MNRGELRAALISRLGIPSTGDALLTNTSLDDIIGYALRDLASEHDWPWLVTDDTLTFTNGVAAAPAALVKPLDLIINGKRARYASRAEFRDAQANGNVCAWTVIGSSVMMTPVPTTAPTASLDYIQAEPALANDQAEPLLPDAHHQVLIARASYLANTRRNRKEDAMRDADEYGDGVRRMWDAIYVKSAPRTVRAAGTTVWARW